MTDSWLAPPPRFLNRVRERIRILHYSIRTEKAYVDWIKRFILFHKILDSDPIYSCNQSAFINKIEKDVMEDLTAPSSIQDERRNTQ